ncbi:MAG: anthranilate synthase component I family protein [Planctomycetota bacterium]|nr:anthranilate synthase component I family protein [Planctomycetota bacterium]
MLSATSPAERGRKARHNVRKLLEQIAPVHAPGELCREPPRTCAVQNLTPSSYCAAVERALEYIAAGDIYQINLAQRFTVPWKLSPETLYWRLRQQSPAEYGAFLGSGLVGNGQALCSISPELFLRLRGDEVVTRPIKGTRPRGANSVEDAAARRELETSPKERAELTMIVDLERNDLGRVCDYGSVRVISAGEIEELPTLLHRVATVSGRLHPRRGRASLLQAAFPGGSVTGAPKLRAMQIIRELEPLPRGPYCGAIGWLGLDGDMELSIAIRTALCDGPRRVAHYYAGSGIVADSDPRREYEETLHKAAAFFRAANATL